MTTKTDKRLNILLTQRQYNTLSFASRAFDKSMGQVIREMIENLEKVLEVQEQTK